jgi:3-oxoacyl-[acyl-carrier-protein] synthase II
MIGTFGSGVPAYDLAEARAWKAALGNGVSSVPALSVKAAMGNNGAGSGAIDTAVTALCLRHQRIPPAQNLDTMDPDCGLNVVTGDSLDTKIDTAVTVGYALNGSQTGALVLKRMED